MSLELFVASGARVRILCSSTDSVSAGPAARGKYDASRGAGVVDIGVGVVDATGVAGAADVAGAMDAAGAMGAAGMGGTAGALGLYGAADVALPAGALPAIGLPLPVGALSTAASPTAVWSFVAQMGVLPNSSASGRLTGRAGRRECVACGVWFPCWTD